MVFIPPFPENTVTKLLNSDIQLQMAGVDLTVSNVFSIPDGGTIDFSNEKRVIPSYDEIKRDDNYWQLEAGSYIVRFTEVINIPLNAVGIILPRSSLLRIGATIYSALWDPGYKGRGIGLLQSFVKIKILENARIAQLILIKTDQTAHKTYNGVYQFEGTT